MKQTRQIEHIRRFQEKGLKLTTQRLAVYEALASTDAHPTADQIYHQVRGKYPMISLNTVYNTLEVLKEIGEISQINTETSARYDANMSAHHHLVCLRCKKIEDFTDPALEEIGSRVRGKKDFKVVSYGVQLKGYCSKCQGKK